MKLNLKRKVAVYLAPLNYTVRIRAVSPGKMRVPGADATTTRIDDRSCRVEFNKKIEPLTMLPVLAHEFVHVLRYICIDYNMDFETERESMAYIMQYLLDRVLGLRSR